MKRLFCMLRAALCFSLLLCFAVSCAPAASSPASAADTSASPSASAADASLPGASEGAPASAAAAPAPGAAADMPNAAGSVGLRFPKNGKLKIAVFADLQTTQFVSGTLTECLALDLIAQKDDEVGLLGIQNRGDRKSVV